MVPAALHWRVGLAPPCGHPYTLPAAACSHSVRVPPPAQAIFEALESVRHHDWYTACGTEVFLYRGAWQVGREHQRSAIVLGACQIGADSSYQALLSSSCWQPSWPPALGGTQSAPTTPSVQEWEPWEADMVVPLSPAELQQKVGRGGVQRL